MNFQKSQELRSCRTLLRASNLLFSTSHTSTSKIGFSKPLIAGLVGTATRKSQHSTRLSRSKQEWRGVNIAYFLKEQTTHMGNSSFSSPTDGVFLGVLCFSSASLNR